MKTTLSHHRRFTSEAHHPSSPVFPSIISESDESFWSQRKEEDEDDDEAALGGFLNCLYSEGPRRTPNPQCDDKEQTVHSTHKMEQNGDISKSKMADVEITQVLTSDESSSKQSSFNSHDGTESSSDIDHRYQQPKPYLVFDPADDLSLIGAEIVFHRVRHTSTENVHNSAIVTPHSMSSTGKYNHQATEIDHVQSPPSTRILNRCTDQWFICPQASTKPSSRFPMNDNEFVVCQIKCEDHLFNSHEKPIDLNLCSDDNDPEMALDPKQNLDASTATCVDLQLDVVSPRADLTIRNPKRQTLTWIRSLFSFFTQKDEHIVTTTQTFEFPAGFWQIERKRTQRERVYIALIMISVLVLVALGIIILIQQL